MRTAIVAILLTVGLFSLYPTDSHATESCEGLAKVGDRVGIKYQVTNSQSVEMRLAAIVIIKNSDDVTVQLSWLHGAWQPNQKMDIVQSWVPEAVGEYRAEVFTWYATDNPEALSPVRTLEINVNC